MISLWYALQFTQHRKKILNWLFIYLDDYRPLSRTSDWLLQTTNQIRRSVYFSDLQGHLHFLIYGLFEIIIFLQVLSSYSVLSSRRTRASGLWVFLFLFLSLLWHPPKYIYISWISGFGLCFSFGAWDVNAERASAVYGRKKLSHGVHCQFLPVSTVAENGQSVNKTMKGPDTKSWVKFLCVSLSNQQIVSVSWCWPRYRYIFGAADYSMNIH